MRSLKFQHVFFNQNSDSIIKISSLIMKTFYLIISLQSIFSSLRNDCMIWYLLSDDIKSSMISLKKQTSLSFDDVVDFAKKHVCNIKKRLYRNIYDFNVYIFEKVIETSDVKILSNYYYTNSEGRGPGGECQENARNFSTLIPRYGELPLIIVPLWRYDTLRYILWFSWDLLKPLHIRYIS